MAEQGVEAMGSAPTATNPSRIHKGEEAAAKVQAKIDRLVACITTLSLRHTTTTVPEVTPVKIFESEFFKLHITLIGCNIVTQEESSKTILRTSNHSFHGLVLILTGNSIIFPGLKMRASGRFLNLNIFLELNQSKAHAT
eukprot:15365510-Ditylum_brightwellii.AAC.1